MATQVRVPDNGFELLIARLAGEIDDEVLTLLPTDEVLFTDEECVDRDGNVTRTRRPLTDEERREVAEFAEDYLTAAGVKPLPRGMAVYLTPPPGVASMDELCEQLLGEIGEQPTLPSQLAAALRQVLPKRYAVAVR